MMSRAAAVLLVIAFAASASGCGSEDATTVKLAAALASVRDGGIPAPMSRTAAVDASDGNPYPGQKLAVTPASCLGVVPGTLAGMVGEAEPLAGVQLNGTTLVAGRPASTAEASAGLQRLRAAADACRVLMLTPASGGPAPATFALSDAAPDGVLVTITTQAPGGQQTMRLAEGVIGRAVVVVSSTSADDAAMRRLWAETAKAVTDVQIA